MDTPRTDISRNGESKDYRLRGRGADRPFRGERKRKEPNFENSSNCKGTTMELNGW